MLLTLTYRGSDAADLGYLLHKNPSRPQAFQLSYGNAYVFYPCVEETVCTAALLLDINPLDLARGKGRSGGLFDYVNDRPYVSSSFMSAAIARVFGTALSGRCDKRQALADTPLPLSAKLTMLPCRGDRAMLERVFSPLGYQVDLEEDILDEAFPDWGQSRYVDLTLGGTVLLRDLLRHLYVLIPVFDRQKHYWIGRDEVEKLLRHGEGWLETHPEKEFITTRYFHRRRSLAQSALDRLDNSQEAAVEEAEEAPAEKGLSLNAQRLQAVVDALVQSGARTVIDMGCGEGNLLQLLAKEPALTAIAGTDVSYSVLERAAQRLKLNKVPESQRERIKLFQSSITYRDKRFGGYDAACVVEVIEHLDPSRLTAFTQVLFDGARPRTIILSTPNREYNTNYPGLTGGGLRHGDHRFEWSREEFQGWAEKVADQYGYTVQYVDVGDMDEGVGAPTQMGVFTRCE